MASEIKAVVFDLGEVLVELQSRAIFHTLSIFVDDEIARLSRLIRDHRIHDAYERGQMDSGNFFQSAAELTGIYVTDEQWRHAWNAMLGPLVPGVESLLRRIRVPIFLLSNTNESHFSHQLTQTPELFQTFTGVFVSHELGLRKPEPEIFATVTAAIGVDASAILFFDDMPSNVTAAAHAGWQAVQVRQSAATMADELQQRDLI